MTLQHVRDDFIRITGRYDLGTINGADNGANRFVNAGQRFLDTRRPVESSVRIFQQDLDSGEYTLTVQDLRSVLKVFLHNADGRSELEPVNYRYVIKNYGTEPYSDITGGTPLYYCSRIPNFLSPELEYINSGNQDEQFTYNQEMYLAATDVGKAKILILPPADETFTVEVHGIFFTADLVNDEDVSYWTEVNGMLLSQAAAYVCEMFYRNTEGMKDHLNAMAPFLEGLDHDVVAEELEQYGD